MIRTFFTLAAVGFAALLAGSPVAAQASATDIIKKAVEATGGEATIKKFKAMTEKSKGSMDFNGADAKFTAEGSYQEPDKMKMSFSLDLLGQKINAVQLMNGDKFRMTANGMEVPLDDGAKAEMKEGILLHNVSKLYPLLDAAEFEVKLVDGLKKVNDKDAHVLEVKPKKGKAMKVYIDAKDFMLVRVDKKGMNAAQQEGDQEMFFSDFKKVEGIMIPMKTKILHDGKKFMEAESTEVKLLETLPKGEFDISD